jgi:hypothetical protein
MEDIRVVKIFPEEYWTIENDEVKVNGETFHAGLDAFNDISRSKMAKLFGGIYKVRVCSYDNSYLERDSTFFIIDSATKVKDGVDIEDYEWDLCCIQEEYTKETHPEYWL